MNNNTAEKFKSHIENNKITQSFIRKELNISKSHLSLILSGKRDISESLKSRLNLLLNTDY